MASLFALVIGCIVACASQSPGPTAFDAGQGTPLAPSAASVLPQEDPDSTVEVMAAPAKPAPVFVDPRTPSQIAQAACRRSDGKWACPAIKQSALFGAGGGSGSGTATQCGPACSVTAWYFDDANTTGCAADTNSCTSATCGSTGVGPCLTFGQIVQRLGGTQPVYPPGIVATFNQLSAQTANQDVIFFEPRVSNGGQAILKVALTGGVSFTAGTVTSMTRGAPGNLLTVVFPGGTVPVKNQLVVDSSVGRNSQAIIDSVSGQTATMQSPLTTASVTNTTTVMAPSEDTGWTTGDSMTVYTLLNTNLAKWGPVGGGSSSGLQLGAGYIFYSNIVDSSGTNTSTFPLHVSAGFGALVNSVVNTRLFISSENGRVIGPYLVGSSVVGQVITAGPFMMFGGALAGLTQGGGGGQTVIEADAIVHGSSNWYTGTFVPDTMYSDGTWTFNSGTAIALNYFWGSYNVVLNPGFVYWNDTGSTFALKALLTSGTLKLGTLTTGCTAPVAGATFTANGTSQVGVTGSFAGLTAFPANAPIYFSLNTIGGTPVGLPYFSQAQVQNEFFVKAASGDTSVYNWGAGSVCGIPITVANLDSSTGYNGLQDVNTGARYANPN
jgi:hypothetical protein